jgi:hypothetical protein
MRVIGKAEANLALTEPLHVTLPLNAELTIAHIGDNLEITAFCAADPQFNIWAGSWVTSIERFAILDNDSVPHQTSELGFLVEHEDALPVDPANTLIQVVTPKIGGTGGVVGRVATTMDGEAFSFGSWSVLYDLEDGSCNIITPITFGMNGSNVVMFPDGTDPASTPMAGETTDADWINWWKEPCRRWPWLYGPCD